MSPLETFRKKYLPTNDEKLRHDIGVGEAAGAGLGGAAGFLHAGTKKHGAALPHLLMKLGEEGDPRLARLKIGGRGLSKGKALAIALGLPAIVGAGWGGTAGAVAGGAYNKLGRE